MSAADIAVFWTSVKEARLIAGEFDDAYAFGDSPELADALLDLILEGKKTATADLRNT